MSFFGNDAINRVNIHSGVQALAQGAGGVFVLVFLLKAGVPTPLVLCTMAAMTMGRFLLRPAVLVVARRVGLGRTLMLGALLEAVIFPLLPHVHRPGPMLLAVIVAGALGSVFYWTSYHAYFAALGDPEHRGGQVGAREALMALVGVVAPGLGGWALTEAGPEIAFWSVAAVQCLAAAPLIGAPEIRVIEQPARRLDILTLGVGLMVADGWFAGCFYYVWQIGLFVTLGERFAGYGGAMALASLVGAAGSLGFGRLIDLGHGRRSVLVVYSASAAVVLVRAAGMSRPWLAVAAAALGAVTTSFQTTAFMSRLYNLAKSSPCPLRFHIAGEAGWDVGCSLACLTAAGLVYARLPLSAPILLALLGAAATCVLLLSSRTQALADKLARA